MPAKSIPIAVTETSTTAKCPLGFEFEEDVNDGNGPRVWVYVQNGHGGALAKGEICVYKAAATTRIVTKSSQAAPQHPYKVVGVAQHAIPDTYYGFILKRGRGQVLADTGGITVDHIVTVGNAVDGRADSVVHTTTTTPGFGHVLETAAATVLGYCYFVCLG